MTLESPSCLRIKRARSIARAIACAALLVTAATALAATQLPGFTVTGRVATSEPHSCDGGNGDLTANVLTTWTGCHEFKQHIDAAWNPITAKVFAPNALRALSVTVDVELWCRYYGGTESDSAPLRKISVETDASGAFVAQVPPTRCGLQVPADGITVRTSARLTYSIRHGGTALGTVRALWDKSLGETVYTSVMSGAEPILYSSYGHDWVIPRFMLRQTDLALPLSPRKLALGDLVFYEGASPYYQDYVRGALGTWQTIVRLHSKLATLLAGDGHLQLYRKMFVTDPASACTACYTLGFSNPQGGGVGGPGGFSIDQPTPAVTALAYGGLVSVGLPAHEFGHSMHATMAVASFGNPLYDDSMYATQDPQGVVWAEHIAYVETGVLQQQELGIALMEGFANAIARYFLDACRITDRAWGDDSPLNNMWNPAQFTACDAAGGSCPYGAFRYQMSRRNIAETSPVWRTRLAALTALAQQAASAGAVMVVTDNEAKYQNFFCDLIDRDPDVSFAAGQIGGKKYVPDYTWHAAEILDGRAPAVTFRTYAADPAPEYVSLTLGQLLDGMNGFIVGLHGTPSSVPAPLWQLPMITDGANKPYNDAHLSVNGPVSPQALGLYLVGNYLLTKDQLNSILRANRMDEVP